MRFFSALLSCLLLAACTRFILIRPGADKWVPPVAAATAAAKARTLPCTDTSPLRRAYFGDLHVHTGHSMDARSRDMLATPDDAYRFARGEEIGFGPFDASGRGTRRARLDRPLDFAAVTDHAEWIGEVNVCTRPGSSAYESESCQAFRGEVSGQSPLPGLRPRRFLSIVGRSGRKQGICGPDASLCRASLKSAWQQTQAATERWNDTTAACRFTTFHGWEHSYSVNMSKVHRNVLFRNASVPELPISSLEAPDALDLWDRLDRLCTDTDTGCEMLTIPHNANVSNGRLFEVTWANETLAEQKRQAAQRARIDRLVEIMQVKGESECKNGMWRVLGGDDELCDFEKIRGIGEQTPEPCQGDIGSGALGGRGCQARTDFARYALAEGLAQERKLGVNPFQFGLIGSTDAHNANPGDVEEDSYLGCCANDDAEAETRLSLEPSFAGRGLVMRNPGGLIGVWATENSRDALFDAMKRRETFATSGPRIRPRFFGGWEIPADLCERADPVAVADRSAVPMGAVLSAPRAGQQAPRFAALAARDPGRPGAPGGLLDRLQIIKVWHDDDGNIHQAVHDVAGRRVDAPGRAAPDVDLASCEPRGPGYDSLCAVWSDPAYSAAQSAVYYARAVENPSCRWSWRHCLEIPEGERPAACSDDSVPRTIRERAWTSPIWLQGLRAGTAG